MLSRETDVGFSGLRITGVEGLKNWKVFTCSHKGFPEKFRRLKKRMSEGNRGVGEKTNQDLLTSAQKVEVPSCRGRGSISRERNATKRDEAIKKVGYWINWKERVRNHARIC